MALLGQFVNQLNRAISGHEGEKISVFLKKNALSKHPTRNNITKIEPLLEKIKVDQYCNGQLPSPYDDILASHFKCILSLQRKDYIEAYTHQANLVQTFLKVFQSEAGNWLLPAINTVNSDLRLTSKLADYELRNKGQKEDKQEDAARILNSCFSICIRDGVNPDSKKYGTLSVINNLFKIYFTLNHLRLCRNLIKPVENQGFPNFSNFPIAQVITYQFYVGRLSMFNGQFQKAEKELEFAFNRCTKKNYKNKRLILLYLIPVKILLGKMPKPQLLTKYNFTQFQDLSKAVQTGNLRLFTETLSHHQDFFIQNGTYLILEKAKTLAYRNLFKRVVSVLNNTKIALTACAKAFAWLGLPVEVAEIECILANLIFNGYIKGYISHHHGCLVVSGKNPFPPLSSVLTTD